MDFGRNRGPFRKGGEEKQKAGVVMEVLIKIFLRRYILCLGDYLAY